MRNSNLGGPGSARKAVNSDWLLLVEGRDDVLLLEALIRHCFGDQGDIQVMDAGGKDQFPRRLRAIRTSVRTRATFRALGVIRDADDNPAGAFQSVCDQLRNVGYEAPTSHGSFSIASPSVGIFIAPGGHQKGAIEALCAQSVHKTDAGGCVEEYLNCLEARGALASSNRDKSFTHAYLAAGPNPVARVGEGAQSGAWDFESSAFRELRRFLGELRKASESSV